ncbi:hypothetical protein CMEL01_06060 [Colletotrichum melonis]|uniref:Uncharacterized protein n=1 Tax=Colletotrichum melonis TaxID=1209925 RepID=A0AAI9U6U7_9PEZI|nr:hypothetical protein CMEL01_06060 [Colletotrichum melonis]
MSNPLDNTMRRCARSRPAGAPHQHISTHLGPLDRNRAKCHPKRHRDQHVPPLRLHRQAPLDGMPLEDPPFPACVPDACRVVGDHEPAEPRSDGARCCVERCCCRAARELADAVGSSCDESFVRHLAAFEVTWTKNMVLREAPGSYDDISSYGDYNRPTVTSIQTTMAQAGRTKQNAYIAQKE